jgi:hypothetical protein
MSEEQIAGLPAGVINNDDLSIIEFKLVRHIINWRNGEEE